MQKADRRSDGNDCQEEGVFQNHWLYSNAFTKNGLNEIIASVEAFQIKWPGNEYKLDKKEIKENNSRI